MKYKVEVYRDDTGWQWRMRAPNTNIIGGSRTSTALATSYKKRFDCIRNLRTVVGDPRLALKAQGDNLYEGTVER